MSALPHVPAPPPASSLPAELQNAYAPAVGRLLELHDYYQRCRKPAIANAFANAITALAGVRRATIQYLADAAAATPQPESSHPAVALAIWPARAIVLRIEAPRIGDEWLYPHVGNIARDFASWNDRSQGVALPHGELRLNAGRVDEITLRWWPAHAEDVVPVAQGDAS
ncbi:MAG: hypothetical protein ACREP7_00020 [Lysobacter sp.]